MDLDSYAQAAELGFPRDITMLIAYQIEQLRAEDENRRYQVQAENLWSKRRKIKRRRFI